MKKIPALILVLTMMILAIAGCNGTPANTPAANQPSASAAASTAPSAAPSSAPSTAPSSAPSQASQAPSSPAASSEPKTLVIGAILSETGWFSTNDASAVNALNAMVEILNGDGGINVAGQTYFIEIDYQDGQSEMTGYRNAAQILANNGIRYAVTSNDFWIEGAMDIFHNNKILTMQNMNTLNFEVINPAWPYSYFMNNGAAAQVPAAIAAIVNNYPEVKTLTYVANEDGNETLLMDLIKSNCATAGLTFVDSPIVYDPGITDFTGIGLQIARLGVDAIIGPASTGNIGLTLKAVRDAGSDVVYAALSGFPVKTLIDLVGEDAAYNVFTLGFDLSGPQNNTPIMWRVYEKIFEMYGEAAAASLSVGSAQSVYILTRLMEGCGSVEVEDVMEYWDSLYAAGTTIDTFRGPGVIGGEELYGINRVLSAPNDVVMAIGNGEVVWGGKFPSFVP